MGTLEVTDGFDLVSFLDDEGLFIQWDSYRQRIGKRDDDSGLPIEVTQILPCSWTMSTDDSRADVLIALRRLANKAWEWRYRYRSGKRLALPVWFAAENYSETNTRYAHVYEITIEELSGRHWGPDGPVDVVIKITHDGSWWAYAPNSTLVADLTGRTIFNKDDADGNNVIELPPSSASGDVDALLRLVIDPDTTLNDANNRYILARRTHQSAVGLDTFNPLFEATDEYANTGLQTANPLAPDDTVLQITGDTFLRWDLNSSRPLSAYVGTFLVYGLVTGAGTGSATIRFYHGQDLGGDEAVAVDSGSASTGVAHFLGRHTIPGGVYSPDLDDPSSYEINLEVDITGTYTVDFYSLWLIPVWEGVFEIQDVAALPTGQVVVDGVKELVYMQSSTSGAYLPPANGSNPPNMRSTFPTVKPGLYNRFYLFALKSDGSAAFNGSASIDAYTVPRFSALRGAS